LEGDRQEFETAANTYKAPRLAEVWNCGRGHDPHFRNQGTVMNSMSVSGPVLVPRLACSWVTCSIMTVVYVMRAERCGRSKDLQFQRLSLRVGRCRATGCFTCYTRPAFALETTRLLLLSEQMLWNSTNITRSSRVAPCWCSNCIMTFPTTMSRLSQS
jgi:hypothetical protein